MLTRCSRSRTSVVGQVYFVPPAQQFDSFINEHSLEAVRANGSIDCLNSIIPHTYCR
jgi:hypothetical protein